MTDVIEFEDEQEAIVAGLLSQEDIRTFRTPLSESVHEARLSSPPRVYYHRQPMPRAEVHSATTEIESPLVLFADLITSTSSAPIDMYAWYDNWTVLKDRLMKLFSRARDEYFENGRESLFSREMKSLYVQNEERMLPLISETISNSQLNPEIAFELLRILGRLDHKETYQQRRKFLEACLRSPQAYVRAGAVEGLALMDDPASRKALTEALGSEAVVSIKDDIESLLSEL